MDNYISNFDEFIHTALNMLPGKTYFSFKYGTNPTKELAKDGAEASANNLRTARNRTSSPAA